MAALGTSRIDLERRRIDVAEAVSDPRGRLVFSSPKTHERRSVPFPAALTGLIRARVERGPADALVAGADGGVLRNGNSRRRSFDRTVERLRKRDPEFPSITPNDLWHTAASLAVSVGASVKAVQRMLGHASAAMTLDVYADLFDDDLDAVAGALDDQVDAAGVSKMWPRAPEASGPTEGRNKKTPKLIVGFAGGSDRRRSGDLSIFSRTLYQLSYRAIGVPAAGRNLATLTGLEPATSAVTGRRANQLRYRALMSVRPGSRRP